MEEFKVEERTQPLPLSRHIMILTTAAIFVGNITHGIGLNSLPPVLENLRTKYNTTIEDITVIFPVSTAVYCIGALTCGIISNYINRQLIVIGSLLGLSFTLYMIPRCETKVLLFLIGGVSGVSSGMYEASQIIWMIEIWQHKAGPFIQAQHFFYAIGANLPSLIIAPFLNNDATTNRTTTSLLSTESVAEEVSNIHIPFSILATIACSAMAFQLFLFTFYRYHSPPMYANENFENINDVKNIPSHMDTETVENDNRQRNNFMGISVRKLKLILITALFMGSHLGMEVSTMQFLPIFGQYSDLKMTQSASAHILTGLIGMFAIVRGIGIIIIFKVRAESLICTNFIFIVSANLILLIWANSSLTMFWIGSILLGTGYATMFPSFCAFMEKHLVFTNYIASFMSVFGAVVVSIYPLIVGKIIAVKAVILIYMNLFSVTICIIVMFFGYKLTRKSRRRER